MLNITEIAREKGIKEDRAQGVQETLMNFLTKQFKSFPGYMAEPIMAAGNPDVPAILFRKAVKCLNIQKFEAVMQQMV